MNISVTPILLVVMLINYDFFLSSGNKWYVDTMVSVILVAGDFVAEPVWHRIVMIVTNNIGERCDQV